VMTMTSIMAWVLLNRAGVERSTLSIGYLCMLRYPGSVR